jgi:hypothetical protein
MLGSFRADVDRSTLIEVDRTILRRSSELLLSAPPTAALRALDGIHLASAEHAFASAPLARPRSSRPIFVSADTRLLAAAAWLGLATDNPEHHP